MSIRETMTAEATSPNGRVRATIRHTDQVEVDVDAAWFASARVAELEQTLVHTAKLLFIARMREYYRMRSAVFSQPVLRESPPLSQRDHEYVDRRAQILVEGGVGGPVHITCVGMEHWTVTLDRAWLGHVDAGGFATAVGAAASELVAQQFQRVGELKTEIWA